MLPAKTTNPSAVSIPRALIPLLEMNSKVLSLEIAREPREKTCTPSTGKHSNISSRKPSASAASASESVAGVGVFPLSRTQRFACVAIVTNLDSMYCTWALLRFSSLLVNAMQMVQKSFFTPCCSNLGRIGSPSPI